MAGPDLGISAGVNLTNFTVGQTITYTFTIQNAAGADAVLTGPVSVTDLVALGLSGVTESATTGWSFTNTNTTSPDLVTATYTGTYPITPGQTLPTFTVSGVANGAALGLVANVATVSLLGDLNLSNNSATVDVNISNPVQPTTLAVAPASGTYGGSANLSATLSSLTLPVANKPVDFHIGATDLGTAVTNALGVATIPAASLGALGVGVISNDVTASFAGDAGHSASNGSANLSVTAAPLTITAMNQTKVYGAALPTLSASYSGLVNGDTPASLTSPPTLTTTATTASHVSGNPYAITASGAVDPDYTISYVAGSLTVTAAPLTITAINQTKVYGAALPTLSGSYTGLVNGDTSSSLTSPPTLTTTATAASHVSGNPYAITASGAVDPDYTISYVAGSLTVTAAPLTITAINQTKVYGAALPTLSGSYTGLVNGDTSSSLTSPPTLTTTATAASYVSGNPYAITASGAVDPDYTISYVAGSLTVTAAPLTITAINQTKVYGAALPTLSGSYTGLVNGDTSSSLTSPPTLTTTATAASHVSGNPYAITASGAVDPDYTISYVAGSLTVTAAPLTITAINQTKVYGAALPTLSGSYTGLVNGDTSSSLTSPPTLTTTATAASHVSGNPYAITASGAVDPDYTISYVAGSLTVTAAPLTITAINQTKVYGAALPTLSGSYTGLVNGDTSSSLTSPPTLTTTATTASHVVNSPYAITASGAVDLDYTISYVAGMLSVTPATLMVTPNDVTKGYGVPIPALSASYSGFVNGDAASGLTTPVNLSTTATAGSGVGVYPITVSGGSSPDYTFTYGQGSLTVSADLTYSAFVTALYHDILGRSPDTGGLDGFVTALDQGTSKLTVTADLYNSSEAASVRASAGVQATPLGPQEIDLVFALYQDVLGRYTEASGLSYWLGQFAAGQSAPQVAAAIEGSSEAVAGRLNPPVPGPGVATDLVTALYQDILGRAPDGGGLDLFESRLSNGESASGVATDIYNSPEAVALRADSAFVTALYHDILGRSPDTGGLDGFVTALDQGTSKLTVTADLYNSSEAASVRASAGVQATPLGPQEIDLVFALYQDVLGRYTEASGLSYWLGQFAAGQSAPQVAAAIEGSSEAVAGRLNPPVPGPGVATDLVTALYQDILGRAPDGGGLDLFESRLSNGESASGVATDIYNSPEAVALRKG